MEETNTQNLSTETTPAPSQTAPAVSVFEHSLVKEAGLALQKPCGSHGFLLQKIKSPVAIIFSAEATAGDVKDIKLTDEEAIELLFTFSKPVRELRQILAKAGREGYQEAAMAATADKLPADLLAQLVMEVAEHFKNAVTSTSEPPVAGA